MIHTLKVRHQILSYAMVRHIAHCMGVSATEIDSFIKFEDYDYKTRKSRILKYFPEIPGYKEVTLLHIRYYVKEYGSEVESIYLYVRMEPLTVVTREEHIALFECTEENIQKLRDTFHNDLVDLLNISSDTAIDFTELLDFTTWDASRVDYTIDAHMRNYDEVVAFINLAKMSIYPSGYTQTKFTSTYDNNFEDFSCKIGNKTWEMQIYNKEVQFSKKINNYDPETFNRLLAESKNIARLEYRRLTNGTKRRSTHLTSQNIMNFLREDFEQRWLLECYGKYIGFDDFCDCYHMEKLLKERFPMTDSERRTERKRIREAKEARDDGYIPQTHSKKYKKYREHIMYILQHKGMANALKALLGGEPLRKHPYVRKKFIENNKIIHKELHISPVCIPDSWYYKRKNKLHIPKILKNPIPRPTSDSTDTP